MNPFRNEMTIKLGAQEILLRPEFENIADMENALGGIGYLGHKFSRGARLAILKSQGVLVTPDDMVRCLPNLTELAKIIFFNQARDNEGNRPFNLEQIWQMLSENQGIAVTNDVLTYIARIAAGNNKVSDVNPVEQSEVPATKKETPKEKSPSQKTS